MITQADRRAGRVIGAATAVVTAVVTFWGIGRPAVWTDEAATADAVRRSWGGLAHLLLGRDAPLVPYYVIAKLWYRAIHVVYAGDPWTVCRWLSAVLACGCVGLLGGWIASRHRATGIVAAGALVALPGFDRYAQEARPYSAMMLVATWSWLEWHRVVTGAGQRGGRYSVSIVALALVNPFALVQVVAQGAAGALYRRQATTPDLAALWKAMAAGVLVSVPWAAWAAAHGRGPTAAHRDLTWRQVQKSATQMVTGPLPTTSWPILLIVIVCVALAIGQVVAGPGRRDLTAAALPWAIASTVLLPIAAVAVRVALVPRYWLSSLPGIALLVGLAVDRVVAGGTSLLPRSGRLGIVVRRGLPVLVVAGLALLGAAAQQSIRRADGHGENSHGAIGAVSASRLQGLPILFSTGGDALVIGEASPGLQRRIVGWERSTSGNNVSEIAWSDDRLRTALAPNDRALLLIRDGGVFRHTRSQSSLQYVIASKLPGLRAHGVDATDAHAVFQGGSWIVAEVRLRHGRDRRSLDPNEQ